jgi:uncharacterized protein YgbK (DUF1537 family)
MIKLAVIADDLTGANDTAVQFAKAGLKAFVLIDRTMEAPPDTDVVVLNTDSRSAPAEQARGNVRAACRWLQQRSVRQVLKKVDSTLRGNLGAEIEEALQQLKCDAAIIAPAFPRIGRITVGGYYLLCQQPLSETEMARDPQSPVTESRLAAVIQRQAVSKVAHVELSALLQGQEAMVAAMEECLGQGHRLITFDATTEEHLALISRAAVATGKRILWVGSAGLAEVLPAALALQATSRVMDTPEVQGPVLIVAGSMSSVTARQLDYLRSQRDVKTVKFDAVAALRDKEQTLQDCYQEAAKWLTAGEDVVLEICDRSQEAVSVAVTAGAERGMAPATVSDVIADRLSELAVRLIDHRSGALILTGGDTAVAICRRLQAAGIRMIREVAPGVPLGCLSGGRKDGLPVVTKAGAFGEEDVFLRALAILKKTKEI